MRRILIAVMLVAAVTAHAQQTHGDWFSASETDEMTDETTELAFTQAVDSDDAVLFAVVNGEHVMVQAANIIRHDSDVIIRVDGNSAQEYRAAVARNSLRPLNYDIDELRGAERILVRFTTVPGTRTYEFSGDGIDEAFAAHGW